MKSAFFAKQRRALVYWELVLFVAIAVAGGIYFSINARPARPKAILSPTAVQSASAGSASSRECHEEAYKIGRDPLTPRRNACRIGDSNPQDEGFHYYQIVVDGAQVPDLKSLYFYGASRWGSGLEVPAQDQ